MDRLVCFIMDILVCYIMGKQVCCIQDNQACYIQGKLACYIMGKLVYYIMGKLVFCIQDMLVYCIMDRLACCIQDMLVYCIMGILVYRAEGYLSSFERYHHYCYVINFHANEDDHNFPILCGLSTFQNDMICYSSLMLLHPNRHLDLYCILWHHFQRLVEFHKHIQNIQLD